MSHPHTLFTGQWADLTLDEVAELAAGWGYDGLEIAVSGEHLDASRWDDDEYIADFAAELLRLANEERNKSGTAPLVYDARYQVVANARAKELEIRSDHTRPNGELITDMQEDYGLEPKFTRENTWVTRSFSNNGQMTNMSPASLAMSVFNEYMNDFGHSSTITLPQSKSAVIGLYINDGKAYSILWVSSKTT